MTLTPEQAPLPKDEVWTQSNTNRAFLGMIHHEPVNFGTKENPVMIPAQTLETAQKFAHDSAVAYGYHPQPEGENDIWHQFYNEHVTSTVKGWEGFRDYLKQRTGLDIVPWPVFHGVIKSGTENPQVRKMLAMTAENAYKKAARDQIIRDGGEYNEESVDWTTFELREEGYFNIRIGDYTGTTPEKMRKDMNTFTGGQPLTLAVAVMGNDEFFYGSTNNRLEGDEPKAEEVPHVEFPSAA